MKNMKIFFLVLLFSLAFTGFVFADVVDSPPGELTPFGLYAAIVIFVIALVKVVLSLIKSRRGK